MHFSSAHIAKTIKCPLCNAKVSTQKALDKHTESHHSQDNENIAGECFECDTCGKNFKKQSGLDWHIRRIHVPQSRSFQCKLCPKRFNERYNLDRHVRYNHIDKFCKFCRIVFDHLTDEQFAEHVKEEKLKFAKPKEVCEICGNSFVNLNAHRKTHFQTEQSQNIIYSCNDCDKQFKSKPLLRTHSIRQHGEKILNCNECDKMFPDKKNLRAHMATTHVFVDCELCGKAIHARQLKEHIRLVHKQMRKYQCRTCGSKFPNLTAIKEHSYQHSTVKRLNCHMCSSGFIDLRSIKAHYLNMHGIGKEQALKLCIRKQPDVGDDNYIKLY